MFVKNGYRGCCTCEFDRRSSALPFVTGASVGVDKKPV